MDETESAPDQNRACNKRPNDSTADVVPDRAHAPQSPIENQQSTIEDSIPIRPRYWWLKRITLGVAALLVFLIALRFWWGWEANGQLRSARV